jgi:hypothetical protein
VVRLETTACSATCFSDEYSAWHTAPSRTAIERLPRWSVTEGPAFMRGLLLWYQPRRL